MNSEISLWIKMLTGVPGDIAAPEALSLAESCRAVEEQIASFEAPRKPGEEIKQREGKVSALHEKQTALQRDCARLRQEIQSVLDIRQAPALARFEFAFQQTSLTEAIETIRRASVFFNKNFSAMSQAQIHSEDRDIKQRLVAARRALSERIGVACKVIEENNPVVSKTKEVKAELARAREEIDKLEQRLREHHDLEPSVLDALGKFTAAQLKAYHRDVIEVRLNDAHHERDRNLPRRIWPEATT